MIMKYQYTYDNYDFGCDDDNVPQLNNFLESVSEVCRFVADELGFWKIY
jgi:hypothetical protein